jgi:hypothetical protein
MVFITKLSASLWVNYNKKIPDLPIVCLIKSYRIGVGSRRIQWALHTVHTLPPHLCSNLLLIHLGPVKTNSCSLSASLMNDFPDISITPSTSIPSQASSTDGLFNQIDHGGRLYLIEESVNFKFLEIFMLSIDCIQWQNANVIDKVQSPKTWDFLCRVYVYLSIYLSIYHLSIIFLHIFLEKTSAQY